MDPNDIALISEERQPMSTQPMTNYTPAQADRIVRSMTVERTKIAELEAENAELRAQVARLDWQPITPENLPPFIGGTDNLQFSASVLAYPNDAGGAFIAAYWSTGRWVDEFVGGVENPTHYSAGRLSVPASRTAPAKERP